MYNEEAMKAFRRVLAGKIVVALIRTADSHDRERFQKIGVDATIDFFAECAVKQVDALLAKLDPPGSDPHPLG